MKHQQVNINSKNLLLGITPTKTNFFVNPATDTEICNELRSNITTNASVSNAQIATIDYDLGSSKRRIANFLINAGSANVFFKINFSDDGIAYWDAAFQNSDSGVFGNITAIGKFRYVRFLISNNSGVVFSTDLSCRCYQLENLGGN